MGMVVPYIKDKEMSADIFSRLLKDRIILLYGEVNTEMAQMITAQLLYLDSVDKGKTIHLYINSPGGSITDGLSIIDTMNFVKSPVATYCMGCCASMGAMILSHGAKGQRHSLAHGEVMIHQPLGGAKGQATDIDIVAKRILKMKEDLLQMLANVTEQPIEKLRVDCERDYFLTASEAVEYGLVDKII